MMNALMRKEILMNWLENYPWRLVQTNLRETDMEEMDAEAYADRLKKSGATVVMINAAGIIASYDTKLPFQSKSEYLHGDSLRDMIDACHERSIRVIARTDFSKVRYPLYEQHPDWAVRTKDGEIINYNGDVHVCPNSDYQQKYELDILEEVLTEFPFDGVFCNMSGFLVVDYSGKYYGPCHCENCKKKFREMFGMDIPETDDFHAPGYMKYQAFKNACTKKHKEDIIRTVREIRPDIAINGVDYIRTESNTEIGRKQWVYSAGMNSRLTAGLTGEKPSDNACVDFIGFRYRDISVSPNQVSLRLWQNLANTGSLSLYIMGDLSNHQDVSAMKAAKAPFDFHAAHEDIFTNQESLAKTVLVRSLPPQFPDPEYEGWVRILTESHIPFDEVKAAELKSLEDLSGKKLLVLGENRMLSQELASLCDDFARKGGTVLADGLTGLLGRDGKPLEKPVLSCLGIEKVKTIHTDCMSSMFVQKETDKAVFSESQDTPYLAPGQTVVEVRAEEGAEKYLSLIGEHPFGPPERCFFTDRDVVGAPGVLVRRYGDGKGIYLAFCAGRMFMEEGYTNTLTYVQDVLFSLAGAESLARDLSPMVELTAKKTDKGMLVQLVNTSGFFGNTFYPPIPMQNLELYLPPEYYSAAGIKKEDRISAKALNGGRVQTAVLKDGIHIILDTLNAYEAVLLQERKDA